MSGIPGPYPGETKRRRAAVGRSATAKGKAMERSVAQFYRTIGRCLVFENSDPGIPKGQKGMRGTPGRTPGIPDMIVFHIPTGQAWFHEAKSGRARLNKNQKVFKDAADACGWLVVVGDVTAATDALIERGIVTLSGDVYTHIGAANVY